MSDVENVSEDQGLDSTLECFFSVCQNELLIEVNSIAFQVLVSFILFFIIRVVNGLRAEVERSQDEL